jgi:hypothetical protein
MIGHKLPNKTKSATVAEPKLFHQLNNPLGCVQFRNIWGNIPVPLSLLFGKIYPTMN